ncbi:hypothetical protein V1293_004731 [Bradyrhizobium sp. AZCC 1693]
MRLSRRLILRSAGALPLLAGSFGLPLFGLRARAQTVPEVSAPAVVPPILFVHGNGDHAAPWITALWRMESNRVPRERMLAINFADPPARSDDKVEQASRSSTEDQRRELGEAVKELQRRTGAQRNSRGGYSIRNYIRNGGAGDVSLARGCGRGGRGADVASAGLFRLAAVCGADRRQGAEGREIRRAGRFGLDLAAFGRGGWPPGGSHVQYRANRGAGLAGLGKPHCDCRIDLLAVGEPPRL